ncbi:MAG TPA: MFS transporter [Jatrophihabitans sp.]|nr:MFS transporter [Jatrophihabitans sp.]
MNVTASPTHPTTRTGSSRRWLSLVMVASGLFLAVVSTTVVSVALPTIGRDLQAGSADQQWIVDAYVLVYASLLVAGGVIGDRRGRKGLFLLGVATFGTGALISGLAPTIAVLLAGRVLQGVGPALLVPGSLTIIRATFEDERERATAIGLWSTASGLALAVGPALGGFLVDSFGWRWVFLFNVPLSALVVAIAAAVIPHLPRSEARHRFDYLGALLTVLGIAGLAYGLIEGQGDGWTSAPVLAAFAVGVLALAAFVRVERTRPEPLIDMALFGQARFTAANLAGLVVFFAFVGAIVYFSAYFQQIQHRSPVDAGLDVSAIGIAFAIAATASGRLVARFGAMLPMVTGLVLGGVATLGLLRLQPDTPMSAIWWDFALLGGASGLCLTPMTSTAVGAVEAARAGMASATHNALRQLGQVLGVAVLGALVYAPVTGRADGDGFVTGLHHALWVAGLALLVTAVLVLVLFRRAASQR